MRLAGKLAFAQLDAVSADHCSSRRAVTCRFPHLRRGRRAVVRIVVRALHTGRARNTTHAYARQRDSRRANNTASTTILIVTQPRFAR